MLVYPIASTQPSWQVIIPLIKDLLNRDVSDRFQGISLEMKDLPGLCVALGADHFAPLTSSADIYSLHYLTFLLVIESDELTVLREFKYSSIFELEESIFVLSENVKQLETIIISLGTSKKPLFRDLGYKLLKIIELGGFSNLCKEYSRKKLPDGTFQLCNK